LKTNGRDTPGGQPGRRHATEGRQYSHHIADKKRVGRATVVVEARWYTLLAVMIANRHAVDQDTPGQIIRHLQTDGQLALAADQPLCARGLALTSNCPTYVLHAVLRRVSKVAAINGGTRWRSSASTCETSTSWVNFQHLSLPADNFDKQTANMTRFHTHTHTHTHRRAHTTRMRARRSNSTNN